MPNLPHISEKTTLKWFQRLQPKSITSLENLATQFLQDFLIKSGLEAMAQFRSTIATNVNMKDHLGFELRKFLRKRTKEKNHNSVEMKTITCYNLKGCSSGSIRGEVNKEAMGEHCEVKSITFIVNSHTSETKPMRNQYLTIPKIKPTASHVDCLEIVML